MTCVSFSQTIDTKSRIGNLLKHIDSIKVVCFTANETVEHIITDQRQIRVFKDMLTGKQIIGNAIQNKVGNLLYFEKGLLRLKVEMLSEAIKYKIKDESINSLYTYEAHMLFLETCNPEGFNIKK